MGTAEGRSGELRRRLDARLNDSPETTSGIEQTIQPWHHPQHHRTGKNKAADDADGQGLHQLHGRRPQSLGRGSHTLCGARLPLEPSRQLQLGDFLLANGCDRAWSGFCSILGIAASRLFTKFSQPVPRWPLCLAMLIAMSGEFAFAGSHPPGVSYPLKPADFQPSGLAQPLPSTRRYVLVWKDQLIPDGYSEAWKQWVVTHYVGTQKLFRRQIDDYRSRNANFLMLVYHLAYGLNGADQTNPVGNITGPDTFGQEDTDTFTPWVASHGINREAAYQHFGAPPSSSTRVSYPDPFWLMDISSAEWRSYLFDSLLQWQAFPTAHATGTFLDVAFPPWYSYQPNGWWAGPAGDGSREGLRTWWNPRARDYFNAMRAAFAPTLNHPRYLVIPNTDALVDNTDEPAFLDGTDGVFTENWQAIGAGPGDWNLSTRRVLQYATSQSKVWMIDVTQEATALPQSLRELLIGTYFLIRNGTSYIMFGNELSWYPEYELDLGGYQSEPPSDLEALRVAGAGGEAGGLYLRTYERGMVLVNSSNQALSYSLSAPMKRAVWSGGGVIDANANPPS